MKLGTFNHIALTVTNLARSEAFYDKLLGLKLRGIALLARLREVYIVGGAEQDNDSYVTEVQFPVEKSQVVIGAK